MKAIQFNRTGGSEVLEYVDVPTPHAGPRQVLVKVRSISVNFADVMMRRGTYPMMPAFPMVPGLEAAGTIEEVGEGVTDLKAGQSVVVVGPRSYAEYLVADAPAVYLLPRGTDPDAAAALPVNYLTVYHMLHTMAHAAPGQTVLIYSAAGGVGTAAIQLGKIGQLTLIGLTSTDDKAHYARRQGIDHIINYKTEDPVRRVMEITGNRGVDIILNAVAGGTFEQDFKMLAPLGQLFWFGMAAGPPRVDLLKALAAGFGKGVGVRVFHLLHSVAEPYPDRMRDSMNLMLTYLSRGRIRPTIHDRLPLAEAKRAHELLESGAVMGKLILKP